MSRLLSLSRLAVRSFSAASASASALLLLQYTRQFSPLSLSPPVHLPKHCHFLRRPSPGMLQPYSSGVDRFPICLNIQNSLRISLSSVFCCQFALISYLSESFAAGAQHVDSILVLLLQIEHLLRKRFFHQCVQVMALQMYGTVASLIFPLIRTVMAALEEALAEPMVALGAIIVAAVVIAVVVKFFRAR